MFFDIKFSRKVLFRIWSSSNTSPKLIEKFFLVTIVRDFRYQDTLRQCRADLLQDLLQRSSQCSALISLKNSASLLQPMMDVMRAMVYEGLSGVSDNREDDQCVRCQ